MQEVQRIPEMLIYEMVNDKPVYYRGYQDYLNGIKQIEEVMASSMLQGFLISEIIYLLRSHFQKRYVIMSNELGLLFKKGNWRAADIAMVEASKVQSMDNKYMRFAPDLVIEVDTKAELSTVKNPLGYYQEKTEELLNFGVQKVIWIFTDTKKVLIATPNNRWEIADWNENIEIWEDLSFNLMDLMQSYI
jgi:Uma2 family endonuclease